MRVPRTFDSVVTELIAGLRSGEITLHSHPNETEVSVSPQPSNLSSNDGQSRHDRQSRPLRRSELETKGQTASGS